jgi:hypothetical protein
MPPLVQGKTSPFFSCALVQWCLVQRHVHNVQETHKILVAPDHEIVRSQGGGERHTFPRVEEIDTVKIVRVLYKT